MQSDSLTFAFPRDPSWKRWTMRAIEDLSGRRALLPVYYRWRAEVAGKSPRMMGALLEMVGTRLDIDAIEWPVAVPAGSPLVIVANHPFGIGDGVALLALAEQLGQPYRILVNSDFLRIPEIRPHALPIDFSQTPEAIETNLETRRQARRLLKGGVTIIVFPAGGVATAEHPFGKAEELPWKSFTARLIQRAEAAVLPVYFEGQNSALFHLVSRYSLMLRLALLVSEFSYCVGASIRAHVGAVVPFGSFNPEPTATL
jgi:putative hemolysin